MRHWNHARLTHLIDQMTTNPPNELAIHSKDHVITLHKSYESNDSIAAVNDLPQSTLIGIPLINHM